MNRPLQHLLGACMLMGLSLAAPTPPSVARAAPPEKPAEGSAPAKPPVGDVPIRRVSGASKPPKGAPAEAPQVVPPVEPCVLAARLAYRKEVAALESKFAGDEAKLVAELRRAKQAHLGTAALRGAGCRAPGGH